MSGRCVRRLCWFGVAICPFAVAWATAQEAATQPARTLSGQVLDHMGGGIRDARVSVELHPHGGAEPVTATTTTDELGDFAIDLPPAFAGRAAVTVTKDLYSTSISEIEIEPDEPSPFAFVELEGDTAVEGVVQRLNTSEPIAGAQVLVSDGFRDWEGASGQDGRFKIGKLPPGGLQITVTAKGFARYRKVLRRQERGTVLTIELGPEWVARVRLTDGSGRPVSEAVVEALLSDNSDLLTELSDEDGRVTFASLPPSAASIGLRIQHPDFVKMLDFEHLVTRPPEADMVEADIVLVRAARIVGRVTDAADGEPIAMARVLVGEHIGSGLPMAWTDPDGRYEVTGVAPGEATVTVHDPEHAPFIGRVATRAGEEAVLEAPLSAGVTLRGQVLDDQDQPVAAATVSIESWKGSRTVGLKTLTGDDGQFIIEHAPPGDMLLSVFAIGYWPLQGLAVESASEPLRLVVPKRTAPQPPGRDGAVVAGKPAPDLTLATLDGSQVELGKLRGKFVFLDFWATWCHPCVQELPNVKKLHAATAERKDFVLIGVSLDYKKATLERFINDKGLSWRQVFGSDATRAAEAFGVYAIPATFLIGPDGTVIATNLVGDELADQVARLTAKSAKKGGSGVEPP